MCGGCKQILFDSASTRYPVVKFIGSESTLVDARGLGWGGEGERRVSVYRGQSLSSGRWKIPEMADGESGIAM